MHFVLTTEQQMLVQSARDYCTQYGASKIIREQMSGVGDYLRNNWIRCVKNWVGRESWYPSPAQDSNWE